jgi:hypothetical protein
MAVVGTAITIERLAPAGDRVALATGAVVVGAGLFLIARAAGLGGRNGIVPRHVPDFANRARAWDLTDA